MSLSLFLFCDFLMLKTLFAGVTKFSKFPNCIDALIEKSFCFQIVIALTGNELVYFELDQVRKLR